jgi:phosphoenolpyruvate carboxylase
MKFDSTTALLYHTYNSLFLSLPFDKIKDTGNHLAIFAAECEDGFDAGKTPEQIIEAFWKEYYDEKKPEEQLQLLFYFIQYIERQVVLFDSVEDALFEQNHQMNGPGSLKHLLNRLDTEALRNKLLEKINHYSIHLVLTAHPTQFYPGKVLGIINDLGKEITGNNLEEIRMLLVQLGKTAFVNRSKPTPYDEAVSLSWYLEYVFYHTLPDIVFRLLTELGQDVTTFANPRILSLGFWPGGDRDGNPFVTAETTRLVAERLREGILRCYLRDIKSLKRRLTFRKTEDWIARVESRLNNTLYKNKGEFYTDCTVLLDDLGQARETLSEDEDLKTFFLEDLDRFILKVRIFGFYFASLDIRQDSRKHGEVWETIYRNKPEKFSLPKLDEYQKADEATRINWLLSARRRLYELGFDDEFTRETIASVKMISTIQQINGELGCHRYIISNCGSALNVAEVLALAQLSIDPGPSGSVPVDVVPLFETIGDLAHCGETMRKLYANEHYARHLAGRNNVQTIMLGFSDGSKDGGYLRSNWSIYRAKAELTRVSREYGISVIFFDGRGGPPGRGGGNNASYYAAHGKEIESRAIQVTIQGQTVSSTYGTSASAGFNIERLLTAGLENELFETHAYELGEHEIALMDELAQAAYEAYLTLKTHPNFVPYLEKMTPLKWYGDSNIASRPTKRGGGGLKFEDLRAIPFVGAWAQMKQGIPGFYGFGAAIVALKGKRAELKALYRKSLFFRTLIENSMQALSKSNFKVTNYLSKHPQFGEFWKMLCEEYRRTNDALKDLSGQELLAENKQSKDSIALREDIVLPLITIQQFALQKLQDENISPEAAEVFRKMVLRAMFGIINAARNAA